MNDSKYNIEKGKELYNQITSTYPDFAQQRSENDFLEKLKGEDYAKNVYNVFKDDVFLGAKDESAFLDSLGFNKPSAPTSDVVKPTQETTQPAMQDLGVQIPSVEMPTTQYAIPSKVDTTIQTKFDPVAKMQNNGQLRIADIVGETPEQRVVSEINNLGKDVVADVANSEAISANIQKQLDELNSQYGEFLAEYETKKGEMFANVTDPWMLSMPAGYRKRKENADFLDKNKALYDELSAKQAALFRQKELIDSYKQYAHFGRQLEVGKRLSSYVSSGKISDDTFKILRSTGSEKAKEQYLTRLYERGEIDKDTLKEIYDLGDLTKENGFMYSSFETGNFSDILSMGLNEIERSAKIRDIRSRVEQGLPITDVEADTLDAYYKLTEIKEKASKEYGFGFKAGLGFQQSLRFMAEMALTGGIFGGAASFGKSVGASGARALIEKYGLKEAKRMIAGQIGKRAGTAAWKTAARVPAMPSMYVNYENRLLDYEMDSQKPLTIGERIKSGYLAYVDTFTATYSETLGGIIEDVPLWTLITKGKATEEIKGVILGTLSKVAKTEEFRNAVNILRTAGVTGLPGEIVSELSDNLMNGVLTLDAAAFKSFIDPEFYGEVVLTSAIMGGMGGAVSYTAGGVGAVVQSRKMQKEYDEAMKSVKSNPFKDEKMEALKKELEKALHKQKYIKTDASSQERSVAEIITDMNNLYLSKAPVGLTMEQANEWMENTEEGKSWKEEGKKLGIVDHAVRVGARKYGEQQVIKDYVAKNLGVKKDKEGNIIPMEFEHEDGNVYEFRDTQGNEYFILDSTDDAVIVIDRATGEKEVKNTAFTEIGQTTITDANQWAMNTMLMNTKAWSAKAPQTQSAVANNAFQPASMLEIDGVVVPVKSYDPKTDKYTITDENGNEVEVGRTDNGVVEVEAPVDANGNKVEVNTENPTPQPVANAPVVNETPVANETNGVNNKPVAPEQNLGEVKKEEEQFKLDEKGKRIWSSVSPERTKQEVDKRGPENGRKYVKLQIEAAKKAVEKANKKNPSNIDLDEYFNEIDAIEGAKKTAQDNLDYWKSVDKLYDVVPTEQPAAETLFNGEQQAPPVVDDSRDKPSDARARGFKVVNGVRYDRQTEMKSAKFGNEVETKFAKGVTAKGRRAIVEANELQPSHINGAENPLFFSPERQPKDRTDAVSAKRADEIASHINPEEITGGVTAYTGAPSVDMIGEAIQGNGRLDALKRMYEYYPEQAAIYKQYLVDHAVEWGFNPEEIAAMKAPIIVNALDVTEEQAIQLGQRTAQDIESGGEQKIVAQNVAQTLGKDIKTLANILLRTEDEDVDLNDVVAENAYDALKWLTAKKVITETQMQTAMDEKGNITAEAREALKDVLSQIIFQNGSKNVRKQFKMLPKAAQKAILQTIARELDSTEDTSILADIQEAIEVYASLMNDPDFKKAKSFDELSAAAQSWAKQINMDFTEGNFVPEDRYSNFAIALAVSFKGNTMKQQAAMLNQLYDYLQAEGGDMFNPAVKLSKPEAVKQVYGVELKDKKNETNEKIGTNLLETDNGESGAGGQGSTENVGDAGRNQQDLEQTDNSGAGADSNGTVSTTEQIDIDTLKAGQVSIYDAKTAIDEKVGEDAIAFIEGKIDFIKEELKKAEKIAGMARKDADKAKAAKLLSEIENDLKFWSDVLSLYTENNNKDNGISGESNTENTQSAQDKGTSEKDKGGQPKQGDIKREGSGADGGITQKNENGDSLETKAAQEELRSKGIKLEIAYDNILGKGNRLWKSWADNHHIRSYALLRSLKQAQYEARKNNGWVSDETFKELNDRLKYHPGYELVYDAMMGVEKPAPAKTIIRKDSDLGKMGIESGVYYGIDTLINLYESYGIKDAEIDALADRVFAVVKNLGIGVIFSDKDFGPREKGHYIDNNTIALNTRFFNTDEGSFADRKKTLLHEAIHAVTMYALTDTTGKLPQNIQDAADDLRDIYEQLSKEPNFTQHYGSKNVFEMVSEMANPEFRSYLKNVGVFKRIVEAIAKFFSPSTTAFTEVEKALNTLIDSFNKELYDKYNGLREVNEDNITVASDSSSPASVGRPAGYKTNDKEMSWWDRQVHNFQDRMKPVDMIMEEIVKRGGVIDDTSDPYTQEYLSSSRADSEISDFKENRYKPLAKSIANAMKVLVDKLGISGAEARDYVNSFLYARHAIERNKHICVEEIESKVLSSVKDAIRVLIDKSVNADLQNKAGLHGSILDLAKVPYGDVLQAKADAASIYNESLLDDNMKAAINELASTAYDAQFNGGKVNVNTSKLNAVQKELLNALTTYAKNKAAEISKKTDKDSETGKTIVVANNRSGMTDKEANEILAKVYTTETASALDEVSAKVKDATNFTLDKWLEYGLISKDEYDEYQKQYKYYIPLRGWEDREDIDYTELPSKQFNMGAELVTLNRHAGGRWSRADNPLAYIASLAMSACITGNRNLIRQNAFNMVDKNASKIADLAVIENTYELYDNDGNVIGYTRKAPSKAMFDKGLVKVRKDLTYNWNKTASQLGAHRVPVMIDGVRHVVYFKGKLGAQAAIAINGTGNDTRNVVMQTIAKGTRMMSSMLTAKNAYFIAKNTVRDLMFGNFAYFVENGFGKGWQLNKNFGKALKVAYNDAMGKTTDPLYDEFKRNGGQTGYIQLESIEKLGKEMEQLIKDAGKDKWRGKIAWENTAKFMEALGKASENAMRFAVYKLERESGASEKEAAVKAKQITVNFNQQGKNSRYFSAMFAFFNPAIQGSTRFFNLAYNHPKRFTLAMGTLFAMKMVSAWACQAFSGGDDEEEGKTAYDRLSDYVKATNLVIPLGLLNDEWKDKFFCIPLAQSVRGPISAADGLLDVMYGKKEIGEFFKDFMMFNIGEFAPLDIDAIDLTGDEPMASVLQAATPTIARPVMEAYVLNRDFMGNPVHKEPYLRDDDITPQHQLAFNSTSPFLVGTSKMLNKLAGGDEKRSAKLQISQNGLIDRSGLNILDINPASVEHLLSGYFGGPAKMFIDMYNVAYGAASKDVDIQNESYPILNQFLKEPTSKPGYKEFYDMVQKAGDVETSWSLYRNERDSEKYKGLFNHPFNKGVVRLNEEYGEQVREKTRAIMSADSKEEKDRLTKERDVLVKGVAEKYSKLKKQFGIK